MSCGWVLASAFLDVLNMLLVFRRDHLVGDVSDLTKLVRSRVAELKSDIFVHVDAEFSIAYRFWILMLAWLVKDVYDFLVMNKDQIP